MNDNGSSTPTLATADAHGAIVSPGELRRRNRRVGLLVALVFVTLVALCAAYIYFYGGSNKPPMKPFHVERTLVDPPRAV